MSDNPREDVIGLLLQFYERALDEKNYMFAIHMSSYIFGMRYSYAIFGDLFT